jgi:hypothetical protein
MNPRVAKYASQVGFDAGEYTWFDLSDLPKNYEDEFNEYSRGIGWDTANFSLSEIPLPAENCAIIFERVDENLQLIFTYNKDLTITFDKKTEKVPLGSAICAYYSQHPDPIPFAIIYDKINPHTKTCLHLREDIQATYKPGEDFQKKSDLMKQVMEKAVLTLAVVNRKAFVKETNVMAYTAIDNKPFLNQKRRAKDKPPIYDWVTIELKPSTPKREHQGGTHASPARHERRGHFRKYSSGKVSWVKPTWVGNIERGMIVHDYIPESKAA